MSAPNSPAPHGRLSVEAPAAAIDVCVCTFRRTSLTATLESLAAQTGAPMFRIIVADNDDTPSAEPLVAAARTRLGVEIKYVHAPARNISIARNACLNAASARLAAFLDDDEIAPPDWLAKLAAGLGDHDAVFGPVRALYPVEAPGWAVEGDFHSFGPAVRPNGEIDTGYSSNVLFRRVVAGTTRFEPALGRTGGEDTMFFAQLHAAGARLGFARDAYVEEPAPLARLNLAWLLRRSFRSGQTHARVLRVRGRGGLAIAAPALAKAMYCGAAALLGALSPVRWRASLIRGALHLGVVAKAFGARDLELYG